MMNDYTTTLENGVIFMRDIDYFFEKLTITFEEHRPYDKIELTEKMVIAIPWDEDVDLSDNDILDMVYEKFDGQPYVRKYVLSVKFECEFCDGTKFEKMMNWDEYLKNKIK